MKNFFITLSYLYQVEDLAAPRNKPAGKHDNISLREKLCFFLRPSAK